jgi:hypothetical protein
MLMNVMVLIRSDSATGIRPVGGDANVFICHHPPMFAIILPRRELGVELVQDG